MKSYQFNRIPGNYELRVVPDSTFLTNNDMWGGLLNLTDLYEFLNEYQALRRFLSETEISNSDEPVHLHSSVFQFLNIEILIIADQFQVGSNFIMIHNIGLITGLSNLKIVFDELDQGKKPEENFRVLFKIAGHSAGK